jgi:hypothetical protein
LVLHGIINTHLNTWFPYIENKGRWAAEDEEIGNEGLDAKTPFPCGLDSK